MRIAYITFEYPPFIIGGAGIHAEHITRELANRGHQIVIFTPTVIESVVDKDHNKNIEVIQVPVHPEIPFRALQFWLRLPKMVENIEKAGNFDIIHFNGISYWFLQRKISNAPHIVTIHHLVTDTVKSNNENFFSRLKNISGETGFLLSYIEKRCIESADKIIAVSKFTKDQIILTYHVDPPKIDVIYNGVDESGYTFSPQELDEISLRYHLQNIPVVLFVGRTDDSRKGLDILIAAFRVVLKSADAQLLVIGKGERKIQSLDPGEPVPDNIIFTGFVDEITLKKCYILCDVYVCPSRLEGFGLTILEAFAAGKPVVATRVGAIPELIHEGKNGILVEKDDISGMASAILYYLKKPQACECVGIRNMKNPDEKFTWETCAKDLEKTYQKLVTS